MAGTLKLVTWNTCGIRDTADEQKKKKIGQRLNKLQAAVVFLQETHIGVKDVDHVDFFGWHSFFSVHHPRSKGVAILIKNELPFELIKYDTEPTGSYIVLICKLYDKCFTLVNVYNHAKERKVLQCLSEYLCQTARGVLIVAGDFNTVLNTDLDRQYPTGHAEPLRPYLEEFISSLMLVDVWGFKNCRKTDSFTRFPWKPSKQKKQKTSSQKKKKGASRLDMVFMPRNDVWLAESCEICQVQGDISDHLPVVLSLCLPEPEYTTTVLSEDQVACSNLRYEDMVFRKRPYTRRAGEISEAEVLKALMSLVEYETPLGENMETFKINKEQKSQELKELYNQMVTLGIPEGFTGSVVKNGRHHFRVDYVIFATILVRRLEKFLQPSFKTKPMKRSYKLFVIVSLYKMPKKIKKDFLKQALKSLKHIHPSPPRDFRIVENLLPNTGQYKELRKGCPLTQTLLTVALKHLACDLKKGLEESMVDVCHHRKCITIYMNADKYRILMNKINHFQESSGIALSPKVGRVWRKGSRAMMDCKDAVIKTGIVLPKSAEHI